MGGTRSRSGFTLVELVVVMAIITIIATMAIPRLTGARMSANEGAAGATLRTLFTAQAQAFGSASIDSDGDGAPEYGYFGELCGTVPARTSAGGAPAPGVVGADEIEPSPLLGTLGDVKNGVVTRSGYVFQIWLPGTAAGGVLPGLPEDPNGGKIAAPFPASDECEVRWCAYAWPLRAGNTGNVVYFVNEAGQVLETANRNGTYNGIAGGPNFDAAYTAAGDMSSRIALLGLAAVDGNSWVTVNN